MLTQEGLKRGRVRVTTATAFVELAKAEGDRRRADERYASGFDFALSGLCQHGSFSFPYPGYHGQTGEVVMLRRNQAEHLAVELLNQLAPGGSLPEDAAELLDFVAALRSRVNKEGTN
jgi:hypothetical protein